MTDDKKTESGRKVLKLNRTVDVEKILASRQARVHQGVEIEIRGDASPEVPVKSAARSEKRTPQKAPPSRSQQASHLALTEQEQEVRKKALARAEAFFAQSQAERSKKEAQRRHDAEKSRVAAEAVRPASSPAPTTAAPEASSKGSDSRRRDTNERGYTSPNKGAPQKKTYAPSYRARRKPDNNHNNNQRRTPWRSQQGRFQPVMEPRPRVAERASLKGKEATKAFTPVAGVSVKTVGVSEEMTVREVALSIARKSRDIIHWLRDMGVKAGERTVLDIETVAMVIEAMGHKARVVTVTEESLLQDMLGEDPDQKDARSPVVAIMGHVDHGKTTLVDALCNTRRTAREAGGITQDVRGYRATLPGGGTLTLIDTPGHAAFKKIRARGAQVVDLILLIVAADDGVQPQTEEAIEYLKLQKLPFIVVITKMDKVDSSQNVINSLMKHSIVPESLGGEHLFVEISAEKKTNLDDLCQLIALKAEELNLRAARNAPARGVVLDTYVSKGLGVACSVLVHTGTLKVSDYVVADMAGAKVRALRDVNDKSIKKASPSEIVNIIGLSEIPRAGASFVCVGSAQNMKTLLDWRIKNNEKTAAPKERAFDWAKVEEDTKLPLVVKADTQGSVEALELILKNITCEEWSVQVVSADVGPVTSSTVDFAQTAGAGIVAFNTPCERSSDSEAKKKGVDMFQGDVIYALEKQVFEHLKSLCAPKYEHVVHGKGNVIQIFDIAKYGRVAGCAVQEGSMRLGLQARITRGDQVLCMQKITSLYKEKDKMKEVSVGNNCGVFLEGFDGFDVGDVVECVEVRQIAD